MSEKHLTIGITEGVLVWWLGIAYVWAAALTAGQYEKAAQAQIAWQREQIEMARAAQAEMLQRLVRPHAEEEDR